MSQPAPTGSGSPIPSPTSAPTMAKSIPGTALASRRVSTRSMPHSATITRAPFCRSCATARFAAATGSAAASGDTRAGVATPKTPIGTPSSFTTCGAVVAIPVTLHACRGGATLAGPAARSSAPSPTSAPP